jgi:ADP-ribose pyrophosphatase YjhB (NUDIX family)
MLLAASGIILQKNKILLLKRTNYNNKYPGFWGCPGGRAEHNETAEENVIREVKEECNLDFKPTSIIKTGIWEEKTYYRFLGEWSGNIILQKKEVADFGWFNLNEAKNLKLAFDYLEIIELLEKYKHLK